MKKIVYSLFGLLLATANLHATTLFSDSFTYPNGNLGGQGGWITNNGTTFPIQVTGGKALLTPTGLDMNAPLSSPLSLVAGTSFYIGATLNFSAAQAGGDYFLNWSTATGSSILISRLHARSSGGGFQLGYLETSGSGGSLNYGSTVLNFNQDYRVVVAYNVVAGTVNDTANVYVDPIDYAVESNNTAYLTDIWTSTTAESVTVGSINLRQGATANAPTLSVDNLVVATTFGEMVVPEPSSAALVALGVMALGVIRRRH